MVGVAFLAFSHLVFYLAHRTGLWLVDALAHRVAARVPPLPPAQSTTPHAPKSLAYLLANSCIEHAFLVSVLRLPLRRPSAWSVVHFYALFWLDDALYAQLHRLLHSRRLYAAVHAHHHAEKHPKRGYADAGNEHPIEQLLALGAHLLVLRSFAWRLDWLAVLAHLAVKAFGSCCNHLDRAVRVPLGFGVVIDTHFHRVHHQRPTQNFAQFVQLFSSSGWP